MSRRPLILSLVIAALFLAAPGFALEPIPEKLVVLTFDDSVKSQFTVARPLLKEYGFGATFFVTEGLTYHKNPPAYMTWEEIKTLHDDGFEIGNHLKDHMGVNSKNYVQLKEQLAWIDDRCKKHGIPKTVSFAWPANFWAREALPILEEHGVVWSRRGSWPEYEPTANSGIAYDPKRDHPYLIPCTVIPRKDYTFEEFKKELSLPKPGEIAVICFHGVPETEHPWVNTPRDLFEQMMRYLRDEKYTVIAMRDLAKYVNPQAKPKDFMKVIEERKKEIEGK